VAGTRGRKSSQFYVRCSSSNVIIAFSNLTIFFLSRDPKIKNTSWFQNQQLLMNKEKIRPLREEESVFRQR
jgi:hypothetical protein